MSYNSTYSVELCCCSSFRSLPFPLGIGVACGSGSDSIGVGVPSGKELDLLEDLVIILCPPTIFDVLDIVLGGVVGKPPEIFRDISIPCCRSMVKNFHLTSLFVGLVLK
jgi:hypothetical protein